MTTDALPRTQENASPVLLFEKEIIQSIIRIAPEKTIVQKLIEEKVAFEFCENSENLFSARVGKRTIVCSIRGLELLWAAAYFYYVFYQEYVDAQKAGESVFNLSRNQRMDLATRLYE